MGPTFGALMGGEVREQRHEQDISHALLQALFLFLFTQSFRQKENTLQSESSRERRKQT